MPFLPAIGKAASWLIPSILSAGGALRQQSTSRQIAREQMAFQERMASSQAQRSREDFEKAGLNPALAYGTQAASPMGASAQAENVLGAGVSSAMAARAAQASLSLMSEQLEKAKSEATVAKNAASVSGIETQVFRDLASKVYTPGKTPGSHGSYSPSLYEQLARQRMIGEIESIKLGNEASRLGNAGLSFNNVGLREQARFEERLGAAQRAGGFAGMLVNTAKIVRDMMNPRSSGGITINTGGKK
nr:MAG: DNA pilot protein [Microviridae sp.]